MEHLPSPNIRFLYYRTKGLSVESKQFSLSLDSYRSSPRSIVHQCQFSEWLTIVISFKVSFLTIQSLEAVKLTRKDNVKLFSVFTLFNYCLAFWTIYLAHSINDQLLIHWIDISEKNGVSNQWKNQGSWLFWLFDVFGSEFWFFIEAAEHFLWNSRSWSFLAITGGPCDIFLVLENFVVDCIRLIIKETSFLSVLYKFYDQYTLIFL
jgi:hypothetical protein